MRYRTPNVTSRWGALVATLVMLVVSAGCGWEDNTVDIDDSDFDPGQASFAIEATSSISEADQELVFADSVGTVYTLTESELYVEEIELELPEFLDCEDIEGQLDPRVTCDSQFADEANFDGDDDISNDAELEIAGPFVLDIVTGETTPPLGDIRIPAVIYQEIDIEYDEADADVRGVRSGDEIVGNTWIVHATFQDEKQNERELVMRVGFGGEIDIEPDDGIDVPEDGGLVFTFDVARWLENIPLDECRLDGDLKTNADMVVVTNDTDAGECLNMEERLENTLKASGGVRIVE